MLLCNSPESPTNALAWPTFILPSQTASIAASKSALWSLGLVILLVFISLPSQGNPFCEPGRLDGGQLFGVSAYPFAKPKRAA
jgi:hypothetical protein